MTSVGPDEVLAVLVAFISYVITHTYRTYDMGPDEVLAVLVAFISYVSRHTYRTYDICGS